MERIEIRESVQGDLAAIERLYPDAFPDEDLLPLVRGLLQGTVDVLSLAGIIDSSLVGHVIFTTCDLAGNNNKVALLGPLAVASAWQKQGIGSELMRAGLYRLEKAGVSHICVLGDPAYYERFGFTPEARITPPYALPPEWSDAWQSMSLGSTERPISGKLSVPEPWLSPALWLP